MTAADQTQTHAETRAEQRAREAAERAEWDRLSDIYFAHMNAIAPDQFHCRHTGRCGNAIQAYVSSAPAARPSRCAAPQPGCRDQRATARYAQSLVVMHQGMVAASGTPREVLTEALLADVFALDARVLPDPVAGTPMVLPISAHLRDVAEELPAARTKPDAS